MSSSWVFLGGLLIAGSSGCFSDGEVTRSSGSDAGTCLSPSGLGTCDTWPQCGCSSGKNCRVSNEADGTTACFAAGSAAPYAACLSADDCGAGFDCASGVCYQYCDTAADCPTSFDRCEAATMDGTFTAIPGARLCTHLCNPAAPQSVAPPFQGCGPGLGCVHLSAGATTCVTAGAVTHRGSCAADLTACAAGLVCVSLDGAPAECRTGCMNINGSCAGGEQCRGSNLTIAGQQIGFCD